MRNSTGLGSGLVTATLLTVTAANGHALQDDEHVMVANYNGAAGTVGVAGDGTITSAVEVQVSEGLLSNVYGIGIGDFDNDGLTDCLIGGQASGGRVRINFHRGTGTGTSFAPGVQVPTSPDWYNHVMDFAVADYDEDGNLDFAVNDFHSVRVHVYLGNGDGTFATATSHDLWFRSVGMDAADIDNDGHVDFVAAKHSSYLYPSNLREMAVFLGDGNGGFVQTNIDLNGVGNPSAWGLTAADFDGDGNVDAVVSNYGSWNTGAADSLSFYRGNGDGTFDSTPLLTGFVSGSYGGSGSVDNADFNHDGLQDVISNNDGGDVTVHLGNGDGTLTESLQGPVQVASWQAGAVSAVATLPRDDSGQANQPPVADAGGPYLGTTNDVLVHVRPDTLNLRARGRWVTAFLVTDREGDAEISLDGAGSSDPDDDELTHVWTLTDNAGSAFTVTGATPSVELPRGAYTVELIVHDGESSSEPTYTTLSVGLLDVATWSFHDLFLNGVAADRVRLQGSGVLARFDRRDLADTLQVGDAQVLSLTGAAVGEDSIRVIDGRRRCRKWRRKH